GRLRGDDGRIAGRRRGERRRQLLETDVVMAQRRIVGHRDRRGHLRRLAAGDEEKCDENALHDAEEYAPSGGGHFAIFTVAAVLPSSAIFTTPRMPAVRSARLAALPSARVY